MSKHVLVITTTLRKDGNSGVLAEAFAKGAKENGHEVETLDLYGKDIRFCIGCLVCQTTHTCPINDDMPGIIEKMLRADVIAYATPIYFYEMSGQMKTLLDRTNPLFAVEYPFRDIYLLAASADKNENAMDGAVKGLEGWVECFDKTRIAGVVRGLGVNAAGEVREMPETVLAAYDMGCQA